MKCDYNTAKKTDVDDMIASCLNYVINVELRRAQMYYLIGIMTEWINGSQHVHLEAIRWVALKIENATEDASSSLNYAYSQAYE